MKPQEHLLTPLMPKPHACSPCGTWLHTSEPHGHTALGSACRTSTCPSHWHSKNQRAETRVTVHKAKEEQNKAPGSAKNGFMFPEKPHQAPSEWGRGN